MKEGVLNYIQLDKMTKENFKDIEELKDSIKEISKVLEELRSD